MINDDVHQNFPGEVDEDWIFIYDPDLNLWKAISQKDADDIMLDDEEEVPTIIGSSAEYLITFIARMDNPASIYIN